MAHAALTCAPSRAPCLTGSWASRRRGEACVRHATSAPPDQGPQGKVVYQGAYGPWSVEREDELEVAGYRAGISITALAATAVALPAFVPELQPAVLPASDVLVLAGAAGLGLSLQLIHIYIDELKKTLQALHLVGTIGFVYLLATHPADTPTVLWAIEHPWTVWLVGPLFASLTGVAFKEGLCYGKWESAGLFGAVPLLLLGHLAQVLPEEGERGVLAAMLVLLDVFAARKWVQPVKDDIGDKSVFVHRQQLKQKQG